MIICHLAYAGWFFDGVIIAETGIKRGTAGLSREK